MNHVVVLPLGERIASRLKHLAGVGDVVVAEGDVSVVATRKYAELTRCNHKCAPDLRESRPDVLHYVAFHQAAIALLQLQEVFHLALHPVIGGA